MHRPRVPMLLGSVLVLVLLGAVPASAGGQTFTTTLLGVNEIPGPGDPDGSGTATVMINRGQGEVCWTIEVEGIEPILMAHIHVGTVTEFGGVVVPLMPGGVFAPTGCIEVDRAVAKDIAKNPAGYYVNVHTQSFMAGALRGQLG